VIREIVGEKMNTIDLDGKKIGPGLPPYIIAEMSGNHNQSLDRALKIAEAAAECGADALKLQTYTADTMTIDATEGEFFIDSKDSLWKGQSLHDLYKEAFTPWEWHGPIIKRCKELGMSCISTPFDSTAVDFLEELGMPFYKIASFENTDTPLLEKVAKLNKPMIVSTGLMTLSDLSETVQTVRACGNEKLVLLKCTSSYPAGAEDSHISTIPHMRDMFDVNVGLSDHTLGIGVPLAAISLGVPVIEKHFTLDRSEGGVDSTFSLEPSELKSLVVESKRGFAALGEIKYGIGASEEKSKIFKRSIYICEDIKAGEILNEKSLRCIRPGFGLQPKFYQGLIGKKVNCDLSRGTPMKWEYIENK
jgi:pseudaminic acid synthase